MNKKKNAPLPMHEVKKMKKYALFVQNGMQFDQLAEKKKETLTNLTLTERRQRHRQR